MKKNKKILVITALLIVFLGGLFFLIAKVKKNDSGKIYKVAVMTKDQGDQNNEEDLKSDFMAGDVVLVLDEGKDFSATEKISYLILKMKLTDDQKAKLVESETKKLSEKEAKEKGILNEDMAKDQEMTKEEKKQLLEETVVLRKYKIDIEKLEKKYNFKIDDLKKGQPLENEVFDWGVVQEKG